MKKVHAYKDWVWKCPYCHEINLYEAKRNECTWIDCGKKVRVSTEQKRQGASKGKKSDYVTIDPLAALQHVFDKELNKRG